MLVFSNILDFLFYLLNILYSFLFLLLYFLLWLPLGFHYLFYSFCLLVFLLLLRLWRDVLYYNTHYPILRRIAYNSFLLVLYNFPPSFLFLLFLAFLFFF